MNQSDYFDVLTLTDENELADMVRGIREIGKAMGSPEKNCRPCEQKSLKEEPDCQRRD